MKKISLETDIISAIEYEKINEFYELVKNLLNGKYSFIIREDITENIMEKYNRCVNLSYQHQILDKFIKFSPQTIKIKHILLNYELFFVSLPSNKRKISWQN